jgi:hypothetical protein
MMIPGEAFKVDVVPKLGTGKADKPHTTLTISSQKPKAKALPARTAAQ